MAPGRGTRLKKWRRAAGRPPESRLLALPCEQCGTYCYNDEPQCPHCKALNAVAGKTA
jgi:rubrerythrin